MKLRFVNRTRLADGGRRYQVVGPGAYLYGTVETCGNQWEARSLDGARDSLNGAPYFIRATRDFAAADMVAAADKIREERKSARARARTP